MKTLLRNCIYQGKNLFRDLGFLFWNLLYPVVLITFFYAAFSGITDEKMETIHIGIGSQNPIIEVLEDIDIIKVKEISTSHIESNLNDKNIDGFIDKDLNILVNESGIKQTIIKEIVQQIKQMNYLNQPMENYDFTVNYIEDRNQEANGILVIFYSFIAMVSTYGVFSGIETVLLSQANLTNVGARLNVTPLNKRSFLFAGVIVGLIFNLISNGILLLFTKFILNVNLFTEIKYSFIFIILGNLFGIVLGIFIGVSNKQSPGVKTMISIMVTLILSFFSGMMSPDIKIMLDRDMPIIGKINPIAIIANNLYRINLLESTKGIGSGILILISYSLILVFASYIFLRRRNYDSI